MDADVRQVLDSYFRTDAGCAFMEDGIEEVRRGRQAFLAEFGHEKLRSLGRNQLLEVIPISQANPQSLDYWLEFRSDSVFNNRRYGSIAGGSQAKFGTWQDKRTGEWQALPNPRQGKHSITEAEAIEIVAIRRDELVAASEVLAGFASQPLGQINGHQLHKAIAAVTPRWCTSAWFHKYLHLTFPRLVTSYNTHHHTKAQLVRLGIVPSSNHFERDIQIMQAWESVPSLGAVGDDVRARAGRILSPRDVLVVTVADVGEALTMISRGVVSLGPSYVGAISAKTIEAGIGAVKRQITDASQRVMAQIGMVAINALAQLATRAREGTVIAIATPNDGIVGIGIGTSTYRFVAGDPAPHQANVHWHLHDLGLAPSVRVTTVGVTSLAEDDLDAVAVEASLVAGRIGPWPGFMSTVVDPRPILKPDPDPSPLPPLDAVAADVESMLERKGQVILYGPPGTGKTYHAERVALELISRHNYRKVVDNLTAEERARVYGTDDPATSEIVTCTFHPAYGYEDFVEGFRPAEGGFRIESGVFRRVVDAALRAPERQFILIIDEINRGNIPRIFGELITLIEKSKRGSTQVVLATSKEQFTVPVNLWIIGAMNTADRSIMLLDTALRRRFAFRELLPEPALLRDAFIGDVGLGTWLRSLNAGIREVLGHDGRNLQVGHAYFLDAGRPVQTMKQIGAIIRDEIWPLLQEYCYEDPAKLTALLGADRRGIYDAARGDLRRELFKPGHEEELASALLAVITKRETLDDDDAEDDSEEEAPIIPPPVVDSANPTAGLDN